jgi:hypothetical protein
MSFIPRETATAEGRTELTVVQASPSSSDTTGSGRAFRVEPFAVEVDRRNDVAVVKPRGELDLATVEALAAALDVAITETLRAAPDRTLSPRA